MKNPLSRSTSLHAGILTLAILAAVTYSSQAHAWGNRGAGGSAFAGRTASGAWAGRAENGATGLQSSEDRKAALKGKFKGKGLKKDGGQDTAAAASANARVPAQAPAGGWRAKLQQRHAGTSGGQANAVTSSSAQSGERSGTYTTEHHGDGTFTQDYTRGNGTSTRDNTVTNENGQTAGWTTQQSVTHGDGVVTGSTTVTGDNGKTRSSGTTLNANTNTLTHTETGANGQTHGVTLQGDGTAGDGDRSGTYTTQSGKTGTYDQKVSYSDGTVTRDNTVTNANGQTAGWTTQKTASTTDGVTATTKTVTGDNGKTESWDTSYDKNTGTLTHTYTGVNGNTYGGTATFNK
jgi:hypothetical protein